MRSVPTKSSLPAARQRFLELLQAIGFGSIEGLVVRGGQPVLDPPPAVIYEVKFGAENGPRQGTGDYLLKTQVIELIAYFDRLGTGTIPRIEVKNGLPFRMFTTQTAA
jgi:hypothetical protein